MTTSMWSKKRSARNRRLQSLNRLEKQLELGQKVTKECRAGEFVLLSDKDIARIKQEISVLKSRI